jgi:hypothetical protein
MKQLFFLIICITLTINVLAQPQKRVEAQRVAFITQRLSLSPEEAQQFWPLFNQFSEKLRQIRMSGKADKQVLDDVSDAEAEKIIMAQFEGETKEVELKKEYYQKFKKVISAKKIAKLYRAEHDFKVELLERLKEQRSKKMKYNNKE